MTPVFACQAVSQSELWVQVRAWICALPYTRVHMKAPVSILEPRQNNRQTLFSCYFDVCGTQHWQPASFHPGSFRLSLCHERLLSILCCLTCRRTRWQQSRAEPARTSVLHASLGTGSCECVSYVRQTCWDTFSSTNKFSSLIWSSIYVQQLSCEIQPSAFSHSTIILI